MKLAVKKFVNDSLSSNAYVVSLEDSLECVLIDIGEYIELKQYIKINNLSVKGLFLTHSHYDHILGVKDFVHEFPNAKIFGHSDTIKSLENSKLNLSFYHNAPIEVDIPPQNQVEIADGEVDIASLKVTSLHTPGHNSGSLSFMIKEGIFTGDALIPGIPVVTKLKSGNKEQAKKSIQIIYQSLGPEQNIYPGHGRIFRKSDVNWSFYNV
ncbi:MBL fold metallo-hydrolase [Akkermansiaceae bacterium]|nr:MBL fold metallo-hydrolase [Akkermansiaceae bacterium]